MTEDEIVGWHHRLNGHEFQPATGVGDGQGSLACCIPWGHRVRHSRMTNTFAFILHYLYLSLLLNFVLHYVDLQQE